MNREKMIRTAMAMCGVILALAVLFSVTDLFKGGGFGYADAEKYTVGEAEIGETVRNLDIHWINGRVELRYGPGSTIVLKETSEKEIGPDLRLRWRMDGDTLRIQYAKSGLRFNWNQQKTLILTVPEGTEFDDVSISATSGDLDVPALKAKNVRMESTSGNIAAAAEAETLAFHATSGDMNLNITGAASAISAETTSGGIRLTAGEADSVRISSTSGGIQTRANRVGQYKAGSTSGVVILDIGEIREAEIGSTSGDITLSVRKLGSLKVSATSGKITAKLPAEPGFTAKIGTASGKIDNLLPMTREDGKYVCGDGSGQVEIGTTSGNIVLEAAEK